MKTLVLILNFETPELVLPLYDSLKLYEMLDYDIFILDNGSCNANELSDNITIKLGANYYFGNALNVGFKYILKYTLKYDSLLFMNSDIIVHPMNFVKSLRKYMFENDYAILSPSIIQPKSNEQCHWKQMHQWNSNTIRDTKWIDFQCPMFSRKFIEKVNQFDSKLNYGWGNDIYSGIVCEENNWKIGVCDNVSAIHLNSYTINKFKGTSEISNYNRTAEINMFQYFTDTNQINKLIEYRQYGENYSYNI